MMKQIQKGFTLVEMVMAIMLMSMSLGVLDTLFSPSKASPPLMAPSYFQKDWRKMGTDQTEYVAF